MRRGDLVVHASGLVGHLAAIAIAQMFADIHGESTSATAEADTLGTELATIALFAVQLIVVVAVIGRVEALAAQIYTGN